MAHASVGYNHILIFFRVTKDMGETFLKPGNLEAMKEKMDIFDCINIQLFCVTKDTINKTNSNGGAEENYLQYK